MGYEMAASENVNLSHDGTFSPKGRLDALRAGDEGRPMAPLDEVLRWLDKDAVQLTHLLDQLDIRLAPVMGEGTPHAGANPEPAGPGTSPLVTTLAVLHARIGAELARMERMLQRVEVG